MGRKTSIYNKNTKKDKIFKIMTATFLTDQLETYTNFFDKIYLSLYFYLSFKKKFDGPRTNMNLSIAISLIESFRSFTPFPQDSTLPTNPGGNDFDF